MLSSLLPCKSPHVPGHQPAGNTVPVCGCFTKTSRARNTHQKTQDGLWHYVWSACAALCFHRENLSVVISCQWVNCACQISLGKRPFLGAGFAVVTRKGTPQPSLRVVTCTSISRSYPTNQSLFIEGEDDDPTGSKPGCMMVLFCYTRITLSQGQVCS